MPGGAVFEELIIPDIIAARLKGGVLMASAVRVVLKKKLILS